MEIGKVMRESAYHKNIRQVHFTWILLLLSMFTGSEAYPVIVYSLNSTYIYDIKSTVRNP